MTEAGDQYLRSGVRRLAEARMMMATGGSPADAERLARGSLADFSAAMNYQEDTPAFDVAHQRLDRAGEWVRQTFPAGCRFKQSGTRYEQTCPAALAHVRLGMSVGMSNVMRVCGVCGQDPRSLSCRHIRGREYTVARQVVAGTYCNLCAGQDCDRHVDGEVGTATCWHLIVSADLKEVSLVSRPAQPMARLTSVDVSHERLLELNPAWSPGIPVTCDNCLVPCGGVIEVNP
jgi:hypothetical protein